MQFKNDNTELNFIDKQFATPPCINVIDKDRFNDRMSDVLNILYNTLVKSFGPGGAGSFISVYPAYYNTKDGFSIMKNISFDKKLDQVICDIVMDICSRLNFTVGDGTTSAVIATKSIYDAYLQSREAINTLNILPRTIMSHLENIKLIALNRLSKKAISIQSNDSGNLINSIEKVVSISSNGNTTITNMITSLYKKLMYPAISCVLSKDGNMRTTIINGYKIDISITDKLYINNDDSTMTLNGANIIMFDHKVTTDTYKYILSPLNEQSRHRGKHLVCIAPFYDTTALNGIISKELNQEYNKQHDINLVLTVCKKANGLSRVLLEDLAMLLHTQMVSTTTEKEIIEKLLNDSNSDITDYFDLDNRKIPGLPVAVKTLIDDIDHVSQQKVRKLVLNLVPYADGLTNIYGEGEEDNKIRVGYCDNMSIGMSESIFSGFYYDSTKYSTFYKIAKEELEETRKKCEAIGTYSMELGDKQHRVYSLGLKTGVIEVGATSEISQKYLKDMVDDSIKAAESAYNNGVLMGCNVSLIQVLYDMYNDTNDKLDKILVGMLLHGFMKVYQSVMVNVFPDGFYLIGDKLHKISKSLSFDGDDTVSAMNVAYNDFIQFMQSKTPFKTFHIDKDAFIKMLTRTPCVHTIHRTLIELSVVTGKVFDVTEGEFSENIINSAETDKEILKATIDLVSLLITGNQLVLQ